MQRVFYKALYTIFQMDLYKLYAWYIAVYRRKARYSMGHSEGYL